MKVQNFISRVLSLKLWDGVSEATLFNDLDSGEIQQVLTVLNEDKDGPYILVEHTKLFSIIRYDNSWITE